MTRPRFASVVLDVDSTLSSIEGIDWLAERRDPDTARRVADVTERAMKGELALDTIYGERLAVVRPAAAELDALGDAYVETLAPGAREAIARLHEAGVRVAIVSGGILRPILVLAKHLGISEPMVRAVRVDVDGAGAYAGFDHESPMTTQGGKAAAVRALALPRPTLAVGDGATDLAMRPAVEAVAAYTGFVRREKVVAAADLELASFDALLALVLGSR